MALRAVLDNLDGLDPAIHEHYTERDGKFFLDIEDDIRRHPKGAPLQAALDRVNREKKALTDKLAELEAKLAELPEDFDAEEYARLKDELTALKAKGQGANPEDEERRQEQKRLFEQRIANLEKKHATAQAALEHERDELVAQIERLMGDEGLVKALVSVGVDKKLMPGAQALLRRAVKVRRNDGGDWEAFVNTDVGESSIEDFVSTWAQSDEGSIYIEKAKGGDAKGSNGRHLGENPWATGEGKKPNLTKQQELIRSQPERARQLAQQAGAPVNW